MMRARFLLLFSLLICVPAFAEITRGHAVPDGRELPIPVDLDGDGLTDLLQGDHVLLNTGNANFVKRSLGLTDRHYVLDVLDLNGDGRHDLLTTFENRSAPYAPPAVQSYYVRVATGILEWGPDMQLDGD